MVKLRLHQKKAVEDLENGKILWGGVGSGKSLVALSYYLNRELIGDIYVITTAKKRDHLDWQREAAKLGIGPDTDCTIAGKLTVDSWNNIGKYTDVEDAFFIFDEQRLIGSGAWVKSFYKIAKKNAWIILSATPGDTWLDYIPVFVANGYYKNATQFKREHVIYKPFSRYPQVQNFIGVQKLEKLKREVLVEMPYSSHAERVHKDVKVFYDVERVNKVMNHKWNPIEEKPIRNISEMFSLVRRIVYSDPSRLEALRTLMDQIPRLVVFYNFNYELDILRTLNDSWSDLVTVAEWNGHKKEKIPKSDRWVYLVQYNAGAEGWNCTETNAMVFYSLNYSYKQYEQAQGRIDRLNSGYSTLYYYNFISDAVIDKAVRGALRTKKTFNEVTWAAENIPNWDDIEGPGEYY